MTKSEKMNLLKQMLGDDKAVKHFIENEKEYDVMYNEYLKQWI